MIAAIADDLTGATEIAGLGWRHGLKADVLHRHEAVSDADLVVFDSDSRHCSAAEARRRVGRIARKLKARQPEWIFKKVDSVLRGNVLAEVQALLITLGLPRCILSPANPTGGRVIRLGRYFIHGTPVHYTDFRNDPHYPRRCSRVLALLGPPHLPAVICRSTTDALPESGIIVAEVGQFRDALKWASAVHARTLPAGGGDFFHALLRTRGHTTRPHQMLRRHDPTLFVCGSPAETTARFITQCRERSWPVLLMPEAMRHSSRARTVALRDWVRCISSALQAHPKVVVGIGGPRLAGREAPRRTGARLIAAVSCVLDSASLRCVCVEGGATAVALMEAMGWRKLAVVWEFTRGVTAVRPHAQPGIKLVCKPGSYTWPAGLLK